MRFRQFSLLLAAGVTAVAVFSGACANQGHAPAVGTGRRVTPTAACSDAPSGEPGDLLLATCLADPLARPSRHAERAQSRVVLYLDRSASMQGFLDPHYPSRTATDFQPVIDRLIVS